ncbi:bifunctional 2-polyprenyl-6-hydroxyphenol methylase/3-demethylubiquinol 3-O-methyltransferase UbiG [Anabaena subtropica]|uniref:3-demethylubiquinone-9 3-O-methyltransferase n=1 Tax=Anabaena subtropica FACHB-260 TaxID=2692884 RepID=A0ABR8CR86_9NOST|nr:bifunctional 2-polyprenyl-6-hydroxyphenol methylase/3-demethylubiquinol 3-O-methyltransferase UbiG [Anabaena subtropica]MBD2345296.1 3-demethylubiquinone-9 3-O-methyltransferase [Anabaena subtropica FACHB-260]
MKTNDLEYYDLNADKWWQKGESLNLSQHLNQARFEYLSNYIINGKNAKVLDVGCGGGLACEFLAQRGFRVSGLDLSLNSIKVAQEHAKQNQLKIDYHQGVAESLPFESQQFDIVLCCDVLEHVNDWHKVIYEVYRVLKTKGLFVFDTINRTFKSKLIMIWLLEYIFKQLPQGLHEWNKFIKPDEIINIMQNAGFEDIVIKGFDLTGGTNFTTLKNIIFKGLTSQAESRNTALFDIQINEDTSVWYIGKAMKP